jgi:hypothetical protein
VALWYWPAGQSAQRNCRVVATYLPGTQPAHTPALVAVHEPLAQTCPAGQVAQSLHWAAPFCGWNFPDVHASQRVSPWALWNWPGLHGWHAICARLDWYVPARHLRQLTAPDPLWYSPRLQGLHRFPATKLEDLPGSHRLQTVRPSMDVYRPLPQLSHMVAPVDDL